MIYNSFLFISIYLYFISINIGINITNMKQKKMSKIQPVSFKMNQDDFFKAKFILKKKWATMSGFIKSKLYEIINEFEKDNWELSSDDAKKSLELY